LLRLPFLVCDEGGGVNGSGGNGLFASDAVDLEDGATSVAKEVDLIVLMLGLFEITLFAGDFKDRSCSRCRLATLLMPNHSFSLSCARSLSPQD
jgi:hypothetical protein